MNKKTIGVVSLWIFGAMVAIDFIRLVPDYNMKFIHWFLTIVMATLFLVGMYLVSKKEE